MLVLFTARIRRITGGYVFTRVCLLTGNIPSPSHNISFGPRSLLERYLHQGSTGEYPHPVLTSRGNPIHPDRGPCIQCLSLVRLGRDCSTPIRTGWGTPIATGWKNPTIRIQWGYRTPLPMRTEWGHPWEWMTLGQVMLRVVRSRTKC